MSRSVELRRHTDNDGDILTQKGVEAAIAIGSSLDGDYQVVVSSGAQRATQTAACIVSGMGRSVPGGVVVEEGIRSSIEDEWKTAVQGVGSGDLATMLDAEPALVRAEGAVLAEGLHRIFDRLDDGQRALAIGHSPTNEAAVFGLTGVTIVPMQKGGGIVIVDTSDGFEIEAL